MPNASLTRQVDLVVIGSGAAGLSAAVTAATGGAAAPVVAALLVTALAQCVSQLRDTGAARHGAVARLSASLLFELASIARDGGERGGGARETRGGGRHRAASANGGGDRGGGVGAAASGSRTGEKELLLLGTVPP